MSAFDLITSRLEKFKSTGPSRGVGRCPAHADRSPSLAVRETEDGRVLMHCFAGCGVDEIVNALGLDMTSLFPPKPAQPGGGTRREPRPWMPADVFEIARREVGIAAVICFDLFGGREISGEDRDRLLQVVVTLDRIAEAAYGSR